MACAIGVGALLCRGDMNETTWPLGRHGVVVLSSGETGLLDEIGPVWYYQYGFEGEDLAGHERVMLVPTHFDENTLSRVVQAHPGRIWVVGNEPNDPNQDDLSPCAYARFYHRVVQLVGDADPSAYLVPAGIADADVAWAQQFVDCYENTYQTDLPLAAWNIHNYLLDPDESQYDVARFTERVVAFRAWMEANGQATLPLMLTEYGVLYGSGCCGRPVESPDAGVAYLEEVTAWLAETDDVQSWAWFCLDSNHSFNGDLACGKALSPFGEAYRGMIAQDAP